MAKIGLVFDLSGLVKGDFKIIYTLLDIKKLEYTKRILFYFKPYRDFSYRVCVGYGKFKWAWVIIR